MAIRLRMVRDKWVALCAVESDPKDGDIYLDDSKDCALRAKFKKDYISEGIEGLEDSRDLEREKLMDSQKVRDAEEEHLKWRIPPKPEERK